jgi:O-methyltransferase involved in polyketide biosynthesis
MIVPELTRVPETLLWTLYQRATEARRPNPVLRDPKAVELLEAIDYPFEERFGSVSGWAQWQALRALAFDREVKRFLRNQPGGTVIALGEGLETQFWRVDDDRVRWLTVDLKESVDLRRALLPPGPRQRLFAGSATDLAWTHEVDTSEPVFVTAQGLFMYLRPQEVYDLVAGIADRLPGATLLFDAVPRWLSERSQRGEVARGAKYQPPPWHWGIDEAAREKLRELPKVAEVRDLRLPRGRGALFRYLLPGFSGVPPLRSALLSIVRITF